VLVTPPAEVPLDEEEDPETPVAPPCEAPELPVEFVDPDVPVTVSLGEVLDWEPLPEAAPDPDEP
jgi:hypothetical protein